MLSWNMNATREMWISEYAVERASSFPHFFMELIIILLCVIQKASDAPFPCHYGMVTPLPCCSIIQSLHIMPLGRSVIVGCWLVAWSGLFCAILVTVLTWIFLCAIFGHKRWEHQQSLGWSHPFVGVDCQKRWVFIFQPHMHCNPSAPLNYQWLVLAYLQNFYHYASNE